MPQAKILWVQDDFDGPINGIAEYNNEKLWFSCVENPFGVSSTDISVPESIKEPTHGEQHDIEEDTDDNWDEVVDEDVVSIERSFRLVRLEPSLFEAVNDNHTKYCLATGSPLNHGDPFDLKDQVVSVKATPEDLAAAVLNGSESFEVTPNILGKFTEYKHLIVPSQINGEYVDTIKYTDFINYMIPHKIDLSHR